MKISTRGLALIQTHEGFRAKAYLCPANVQTIGYGTTQIDGKPVTAGMTCTKDQAATWLRKDVEAFEKTVNAAVTSKLTQNQFDALVSFTYNVGSGAFSKSTLLRKLNAGDYLGAALEFGKWNKGGGKVLPGLVARRVAERTLFQTPA